MARKRTARHYERTARRLEALATDGKPKMRYEVHVAIGESKPYYLWGMRRTLAMAERAGLKALRKGWLVAVIKEIEEVQHGNCDYSTENSHFRDSNRCRDAGTGW